MSAFDQAAFNKKPHQFMLHNRGPRHRKVEICGSFDEWQVRHEMNFDPFTNQWFINLHLKTGEEFLYKYVINDSQWVLQLGESSALTDSQIKTQYENNPDTNAFTDAEKTKLSNQSGNNTGDETTSTIQSKRAIKTIVGESLEGTGNVEVIKSVVSLGGGTTLLKEIVSNIARFKTIEAQGGTFLEIDGDKIIINSPIVDPFQ